MPREVLRTRRLDRHHASQQALASKAGAAFATAAPSCTEMRLLATPERGCQAVEPQRSDGAATVEAGHVE
jgi:hypothetical protein